MNKQAIFDQVLAAMRKQGQPSAKVTPGGSVYCMYRGPEGTKCGIGHLIPDDVYDPAMESKPVLMLLESFPQALGFDPEVDVWSNNNGVFLDSLQQCHDNAVRDEGSVFDADTGLPQNERFMRCYEKRMSELAHARGLTYAPPQA